MELKYDMEVDVGVSHGRNHFCKRNVKMYLNLEKKMQNSSKNNIK